MPNTTNYNWATPADSDLVKDGALAIRTLGTAIDSTVFTNAGNAINKTIIDAKGDLIVGTAADTAARLAVGGTNGFILTVDSTQASGIKWAAPAGGGKVLQVIMGNTSTEATSASTSYADTGLTASITPASASNKVLVLIDHNGTFKSTGDNACRIKLFRDATEISQPSVNGGYNATATRQDIGAVSLSYLDTPATTSSITYKTQYSASNTQGDVKVQHGNCMSTIILMEIGA